MREYEVDEAVGQDDSSELSSRGRKMRKEEIESEDLDAEGIARGRQSGTCTNEAPLTLYLREIGTVKLLTPDEEKELAARVRQGDAKAREHMIKANLRLVVRIARAYEGLGMPLLDLINEGNIGLMKGVERYQFEKGSKLSTYAALWIKQSIRRALSNQSKTVRVPIHMVDKLYNMRNIEVGLEEDLGRRPTDEELAEEMGVSAKRIGFMRSIAKKPLSLDALLEENGSGKTFADVCPDENAISPALACAKESAMDILNEYFPRLTEREVDILSRRFGLKGGPPQTLEEVGLVYDLTRERIRQLQEIALEKLRAMFEARGIGDALSI